MLFVVLNAARLASHTDNANHLPTRVQDRGAGHAADYVSSYHGDRAAMPPDIRNAPVPVIVESEQLNV